MPSQISILNHALDLVAETAITDISAATEPAERLLAAWDDTRDAALRARWWNFSIERTTLPADASAPSWGYAYSYTMAGDVVRPVQVDQYYYVDLSDLVGADTSPFAIEGRQILTDIPAPLKVRWIVNSKDIGEWDACFARVMACDLAERICPRMTGSETMVQRIAAQRRRALDEALRANAIELPPKKSADSSWMAARFSV